MPITTLGRLFMSQEEKDRTIRMFREGKTLTEIGKACGVEPGTIQRRLQRFGVIPPRKNATWKPYTPEERKRACELYASGIPLTKIGVMLGRGDGKARGVSLVIRREGGAIRPIAEAKSKYKVNHDAFDVLTPEACYWAGFFLADGCSKLISGTPHIKLGLKWSDADHVRKFRDFLGSDAVVHREFRKHTTIQGIKCKCQDAASVCVRSKKLADRLAELGSPRRKTFAAFVPIELKMNVDFWRGVIDGDGCIRWAGPYGPFGKMTPTLGMISGCLSVAEDFVSFCRVISPGYKGKIGKVGKCYTIQMASSNAVNVCRAMYYPGAVSLDRKEKVAMEFLTQYVYAGKKKPTVTDVKPECAGSPPTSPP